MSHSCYRAPVPTGLPHSRACVLHVLLIVPSQVFECLPDVSYNDSSSDSNQIGNLFRWRGRHGIGSRHCKRREEDVNDCGASCSGCAYHLRCLPSHGQSVSDHFKGNRHRGQMHSFMLARIGEAVNTLEVAGYNEVRDRLWRGDLTNWHVIAGCYPRTSRAESSSPGLQLKIPRG